MIFSQKQVGHVFVINLRDRKDRWDQLTTTWKDTFTFHRFEAVEGKTGNEGCCLSHFQIISFAKQCNLPYVLVWEDDVTPMNRENPKDTYKRWCALEKKLQTCVNDWKVI